MTKRVLVTGGAGFIGSHTADLLLRQGYQVRVLDNLLPQVHGPHAGRPDYLDPDVELVVGDVRDQGAVQRALRGVDAVFHFAAAVGVGQSMYRIADYVDVNVTGTGVLLQALIERPVERLVVASSMSVYGEGCYLDSAGREVDGTRSDGQLRDGRFEPQAPDGTPLKPVPTPESKPPAIASIYAMSKLDQECMCLMIGKAYRIPAVALRFFNVYGERQALSNPYTGVLAIFASRLINNNPPLVFEDGEQRRDFVHVRDVAQACMLALEKESAVGEVFNIGSGRHVSIRELAVRMGQVLGREIEPQITGRYRIGDIRHCFADIAHARARLGYEPRIPLESGMEQLAHWLAGRTAEDHALEASRELAVRGLTV